MIGGMEHHRYKSVCPTVQQTPPPRTQVGPQQQSTNRQPIVDNRYDLLKKPGLNTGHLQRTDRSGSYGKRPDRPQERNNYQNQQMRQGDTGNLIHRPSTGPFPQNRVNRPNHQMPRPVHMPDRRTRDTLPHQTPAPSNAEVDKVLEEMIVLNPPISAIEATPRTEINNSGLFFHPPTATLSEIRPPARLLSAIPKPNELEENLHNLSGTSADLGFQLALSEESDEDAFPIVHHRMLSPIAATPAANRMEDIPQIVPPALELNQNREIDGETQDDSSSNSGSDSGSDSDSSSEESDNEKEEENPSVGPPQLQTPPKTQTPPPTFEADTEEHKKRWNLASYIVSEHRDTIPALSPIYPREKSLYESSEYLNYKNALPPNIFSDKFSGISNSRNTLKDSNKIVTRHSDDSDSEDGNRTNVNDIQQQKKRTSSVIYNSDSISDSQSKKVKQLPIANKQIVPSDIAKPKSNRGRPRKIKPEDTENGEIIVKKRGRPKLPKNELKTKQRTFSISDADVQVKKRGRPKKKKSSDDESENRLSNLVLSSDDEIDGSAYKKARTDEGAKIKNNKPDDRSVKSRDASIEKINEKQSAPFRRKSGKISRNIKSSETVPTSSDSDSDEEKPRHTTSDSELSDSIPSKCSVKDKKMQSTTPKREEKDKDRVQDKNKSDFLRKLYTPKRDSEGGKGGGKGGAKGGKGKGGVSVFIRDGDYERSTSIPGKSLFTSNDVSPLRTIKTENVESLKHNHQQKPKGSDEQFKEESHSSKERHSKINEKNSKTKEKDQKSKDKHQKSNEKDKSKDRSSKQSKDHEEESKLKSKKRKRDHSRSSSGSVMSNKSSKNKKSEEPPSNKNKADNEKSSNILHSANLHPTNHERTSQIDGKGANTDDSKSSSKKELSKQEKENSLHKREQTYQEKVPQVEAQKSSTKASSVNQQKITYSNDQKPTTSNENSNQKEVCSYFERVEEPAELDGRDQNQYLVEANRLKHLADTVSDPVRHCLLYMDAVLYFLLTGDAMESEKSTEDAAFTMFRDTLSLIEYISGRYKQQHLFSKMFTTLAVLNYRCQSRLYYKLLEIKRRENKEHQKIIADFCNKSAVVPSEPQPNQNGQPTATAPVTPSGFVGSIGSHSSSGYSSSDLSNRNQGIWVPMPVHNAISMQNQHFTYLFTFMDLWETADNLVQNAGLTNFFIQLDKICTPLTLHSTIRHLVSYVKRGILLVQREMQEQSS